MSSVLFRLGRYSFDHPFRILGAWLLVIAAVVALLVTQPRVISSGLTLDDTPSQQVMDSISATMPQAQGTQGSLVFTSADGARVDITERAAAIVAALDATHDTGFVVDRVGKLEEQRAEVDGRIREQVETKVAAELSPQLAALGSSLDAAAAAVPPDQRDASSLVAELDGMAARAKTLSTATPSDQIDGSTALFADLEVLVSRLKAAGAIQALTLQAPSGEMSDPRITVDEAVAKARTTALADLDRLTSGTSPQGEPLLVGGRAYRNVLVSTDGRTAVASVLLTDQVSDLPEGVVDSMLEAAGAAAGAAGLEMSASTSLLPAEPPLGGHEALGLLIAAVVLILALGSLVAAGLPILTALAGVFIGVGGAFALSANFHMTTSTPALGLMIGLAVGIDYALFVVHKHRSLIIRTGRSARDVVGEAVGTAGSAVLFAGLTVVIALLGLLTLGIAFVNTMALTAATTVTLAVLIALTALPALLGLVGERVASNRARQSARRPGRHRIANGWVSAVTRRPWLTILGVVALLGLVALPAPGLDLGMPSGAVAQAGSPQRTSYDAITKAFGEGTNAPLIVLARERGKTPFDQAKLLSTQQALADMDGVVDVALMGSSPDSELAIYQVTPEGGPNDESTAELVTRLRSVPLPEVGLLGVTGLTAMNIDLSEALADAIPVYVVLVVVLSLLVLLVVFRSLLVTLAATFGFLLTMAAVAGLVVTVFGNPDWTWVVGVDRPGPILPFLPIMATGILYGLANDYQLFLGTSIREDYVRGADPRASIRSGFVHAGRVVVAAAIIMVAVFGGFVLSSDTTIRQFGFALSAGVLIDAFLIRMTLIPALLHLAGERAWWLPRWLDDILPTLDIEGNRLHHGRSTPPDPTTPAAAAPAEEPQVAATVRAGGP
ncbi:MMPL family transporter [Nostocoides sp.]|uniref:MMPL family transporter n=1 Tax=Nostocoides sp. TaxID=1917966 RepID=UPI003BAE17AF